MVENGIIRLSLVGTVLSDGPQLLHQDKQKLTTNGNRPTAPRTVEDDGPYELHFLLVRK